MAELQKAEADLLEHRHHDADRHLNEAVRKFPFDYAALLMLAKSTLAQQPVIAQEYLARARAVYPEEPQALHLDGMANLAGKNYDAALNAFGNYGQELPGNPNTSYYKGLTLERLHRRNEAAPEYQAYLEAVNQGDEAEYARARLLEWGYLTPPASPAAAP